MIGAKEYDLTFNVKQLRQLNLAPLRNAHLHACTILTKIIVY